MDSEYWRLYKRNWRCRNLEKDKENQKIYYASHKEQFKKYYREHRKEYNERNKKWLRKIKRIVFAHYSNNTFKCAICGYSDMRALCLDHINNDGAKEKAMIGRGSKLRIHIVKNNFPDKYQILCANCNQIKEAERIDKMIDHLRKP